MDAAWALAVQCGPTRLTMSRIAQEAGIGRATLYRYFPDVAAILQARHDNLVLDHLRRLDELRQGPGDAMARLEAVSQAYARLQLMRAQHGTPELATLVHKPEHLRDADLRLLRLFEELLAETAATGKVRGDVAVRELAIYCLSALGAAGSLSSEEAVQRLVSLTLAALRP